VSSREERERIAHELEARALIPDRARRAAIQAEAEQVARRVEQKRQEAVAAKLRLLAIQAKADDRIDWPDDDGGD
jgi:hypothetical protein